jgi:organic radical activating enzyme
MAEEDIMKEVCKNPSQHVCITGGEPLLQDLSKLLNLLGFFYKHLETNGTLPLPEGFNFDYICISPKEIDINLNILRASEIKVLCGPGGWEERVDFFRKRHPRVSLQPLSTYQIYTDRAIKYVKKHPGVRLSIQVHKLIGER